MQAVFINLDKAGERRAFMERQARELGLVLQRRSAVDAGKVTDENESAFGRAWTRPLSRAEIACLLSHLSIWEEVATSREPLLILEDDVLLSPRLAEVMEAAPGLTGIDFLNLEDFGKRRFVAKGAGEALGPALRRHRLFRDKAGSAAYLIWPAGAAKLVRRARTEAAPADAFIHGAGLQAWLCEPALAVQAHVLGKRRTARAELVGSSVPRRQSGRTGWRQAGIFLARRAAIELRLAAWHAARLGRADYRTVTFDAGALTDALRRLDDA